MFRLSFSAGAASLIVLIPVFFVCSPHRTGNYRYEHGTTAVLTKAVTPLNLEVVEESVHTMDTS